MDQDKSDISEDASIYIIAKEVFNHN